MIMLETKKRELYKVSHESHILDLRLTVFPKQLGH